MATADATLLCIILVFLAIFQLLLIAGLPLGRFAWAGRHEVLPTHLRIGTPDEVQTADEDRTTVKSCQSADSAALPSV
ncbi:hypothetical protein E3O45_02495 [Cryobacterium sp. TMS1-20-1]|uniref:hypothetical protein n=1 Tax=Cryobacterium sp. TMS1-20-1 TaxID=1259223 RepID=UPI00106B5379|nr:hypothetical protein [Cryobacterium sp. TMS1-20-1]TFC80303.1 hypothetical protein E3O45_02495 [Cryobacterium sp. TMS1-20-1]